MLFMWSMVYIFYSGSKDKFSSILQKYVDNIKSYYKRGATIVFDGCDIDSSAQGTKSCERLRCAKNYTAPDVQFYETMSVTMTQQQFLSNNNNKQCLSPSYLRSLKRKPLQ
jgi:hypothetical protein